MSAGASPADRDLDLVVIGDVNPDILVIGADPQFGQREVLAESISMAIGGSAAIMAAAAARLGLRTALVGVVGDDPFGRFVLGALAERGVDTSNCIVEPARPTGVTVLLVRTNDRAILTAPGTIAELGVDQVPQALLRRARHTHIGSFYLQSRLRAEAPALVARAHGAGTTVSLDPNWDPSGKWDGGLRALLPELDVFLPNEAEALHLTRRVTADEAAASLQGGRGQPAIVIKRGPDGAFGLDERGVVATVSAFPIEPVDSTGAGDAFDAGFLAARLEGRPFRSCLRFAAVCGALSTLAVGGAAGQPTREEVEDALATWADD